MKEVLSGGKSLEESQLKECKREERTIKIDLGKTGFGDVNLKEFAQNYNSYPNIR
jgi:hypothetical protein